jgi:Ca-activated chloride channel homolog
MPGISGPSVFVSLSGVRLKVLYLNFANSAHHALASLFLCCAVMIAICSAGAFAQTGDITDVHITPRNTAGAAAPAAAAAVASPDVSTPSIGLKSADRALKVNVNLVLVPVTVTDPMNRLVTGLERENFSLAEGSQGQQIRTFSSEDAPLSLGVIFDLSGSMGNKIDKSKQAVIEFFKTANPDDEFFMIGFSDKPELICDFTNSIEDIQSRLVFANAK